MYLELCEFSNEASAMSPISCDASQTSEAEMDIVAKDPKVEMKPNQLNILCTKLGYFNCWRMTDTELYMLKKLKIVVMNIKKDSLLSIPLIVDFIERAEGRDRLDCGMQPTTKNQETIGRGVLLSRQV
ncbi:hypothetical protein TNCT_711161 [Trichonephila clavata]|uniref:Uncharacterized protein n=1 Tax=Trichonephila clavata TaxID=2740835 RepID=A0A8X6IVQ6_TRICU|nr:hypothetical protein TNCT_711161 [Trichonephila clavata]